MVNNILDEYFKGMVAQINDELSFISKMITHNLEKGENNEEILKDFLKKFLPKKFSITSGFVIDKSGGISKQCDIIIYDNHYNPEMLNFRTIKMIPVDFVYAVIEVKTTLDQNEIKSAIENIESVKKLDYIKKKISYADFNPEDPSKLVSFGDMDTTPPMGFVFAYNTNIVQLQTIKDNIASNLPTEKEHHINSVLILNKGFIFTYYSVNPKFSTQYQCGVTLLINKQDQKSIICAPEEDKKILLYEGMIYPLVMYKEHNTAVDPARAFLNFMLHIFNGINTKRIIENTDIAQYYLPEYYKNLELL